MRPVRLNRAERDWLVLDITTTPTLTGTWQASFDRGETWIDGHPSAGGWAWLLAGPDFDADSVTMDDDDTDATITADVLPLLRIADDPVLDVEQGPRVQLYA